MIYRLVKSRSLLSSTTRQFAAINSNNFSLDSVSSQDLLDSEPKAVGAVIKAL